LLAENSGVSPGLARILDRVVVGNRLVIGIGFFIRNRLVPRDRLRRNLMFVVDRHITLQITIGIAYSHCAIAG